VRAPSHDDEPGRPADPADPARFGRSVVVRPTTSCIVGYRRRPVGAGLGCTGGGGGGRGNVHQVISLAQQRGVNGDPRVRQQLADLYTKTRIQKLLSMRTLTAATKGKVPLPFGASIESSRPSTASSPPKRRCQNA